MKTCFRCLEEKPHSEFYEHGQMKDGTIGKCKECTKKDVQINYRKNRDHYVTYERERFQRPERKAKALEYQRKRREANPLKYKACSAVSNAVRDGRLKKQPCKICGAPKSQAHHEDYGKPLDVTWLCRAHHLELHGKVAY